MSVTSAPRPGAGAIPIEERLREFGAPSDGIRSLNDAPTAQHVRYLDLMLHARRPNGRGPDAVVEVEGEPIAYAIDTSGVDAVDLGMLRRSLVFRADAPYFIELQPGQIVVHSLGADALTEADPVPMLTVRHGDDTARTTFQRLFYASDPLTEATGPKAQSVHERLFALLSETVGELIDLGLTQGDALSLAGRAMFTRFLVDRRILSPDLYRQVAKRAQKPEEFFATASNAADTCRWLDRTFNGDFLPLSFAPTAGQFGSYTPRVFENLSDIMHCRRGKQLFFHWENIDLSSVPAGLLSQIYEHQAERWNPHTRHQDGVYYTPRRIADYMVAECFAGMRAADPDRLASATVLDPAVGGGVFLVAAFRELVCERWRKQGKPPRSREIREILYGQLRGFDVSEPALRLSALSLYLTALELDTDPKPLSELKFEKLRGRVLFDVSEPNAVTGGARAGSLRHLPGHEARYDVVIGNPPWTAITRAIAARIEHNVTELVRRRHRIEDVAVELPDNVPDVAFAWASTVWARDDAWIALALHARVLFKQSAPGVRSRNALFAHLDVTGILNGTALRNTRVWPTMTQPFCFIFARNRRPSEDSAFYFVSPNAEFAMNAQGRFRIDSDAAQPVSTLQVPREPALLKSLFRGGALDVAILRKIRARSDLQPLVTYWGSIEAATTQGYQTSSVEQDAAELKQFRDLGSRKVATVEIDTSKLPMFNRDRVHRVRELAAYRGPVVLVRKSPPTPSRRATSRPCALSWTDVTFSESWYGWSTKGQPDEKALAKYLFLVVNSPLLEWYALVTSSEFGVERESVQKQDIEALPIMPFALLSDEQVVAMHLAYDALRAGAAEAKARANALIADAYGLSGWDMQVMEDTLSTRLPYPDTKRAAERPPSEGEARKFVGLLAEFMSSALGAKVAARLIDRSVKLGPWRAIGLHTDDGVAALNALSSYAQLADKTGASRVLIHSTDGRASIVCLLWQLRYWTPSRARILALDLVESDRAR